MSTDTIDNFTKVITDKHIVPTDDAAGLYFSLAVMYEADYEVWAQYPFWTSDEAIALSLGKNPKLVNWFTIQPLIEVSPFARRYAELRNLVTRAVQFGEIPESCPPYHFMRWILPRFTDFPEKLAFPIKRFTEQTEKPTTASAQTRERHNLLIMLYCIAVEHFGYTNEKNNSATTKMLDCLNKVGVNFTSTTLRDKITEGATLAKERIKKNA